MSHLNFHAKMLKIVLKKQPLLASLEKYKTGTFFVDFKPLWYSIPTLFVVVLITFSEELGKDKSCTLSVL